MTECIFTTGGEFSRMVASDKGDTRILYSWEYAPLDATDLIPCGYCTCYAQSGRYELREDTK